MKCLDKKRIKMKGGETLALNERIMLSLVSNGVSEEPSIFPLYLLAFTGNAYKRNKTKADMYNKGILNADLLWY